MRGQETNPNTDVTGLRITPADAGTRRVCSHPERAPQDHPRGCGDKRKDRHHEKSDPGSPPRMRGQVAECVPFLEFVGITPADAGTSD